MPTLAELRDAIWSKLPTRDEVEADRVGKAIPKGPSRLTDRIADDRDEKAAERAWRKLVIKRDGHICRCCERRVVPSLALSGNRLEVHHIAPRADRAVRWDVRNGLVLCAICHEKVTPHSGKLELVILQAARFLFSIGSKTYINAAEKVTFQEAA